MEALPFRISDFQKDSRTLRIRPWLDLLVAGLLLFVAPGLFPQESAAMPMPAEVDAILDAEGRFLQGPIRMEESSLLGLQLPEALDGFGAPLKMYAIRGEQAWQDDVVFFYGDFFYLYWFQDRVWQIRYDHRHEDAISGIRMGMNRQEVEDIWGPPHYQGLESLFYDLEDAGYPMRVRLYFRENFLHDLYLYRSDF